MIDAKDILAVVKKPTKEWTQQRKKEDRGSRSRRSRMYAYSDRVNFTDIAAKILPVAYDHASGNGCYSVSKRQLYYACREKFKEMADRELDYSYFASTLLVQYMNRTPATSSWKVTADPRGTLRIPNGSSETLIPCGTIAIENHLESIDVAIDPVDFSSDAVDRQWPSRAPGQRYQAVLYIEKEGFNVLLEEAKIAERFDVAILSCKGQSVVAARQFVDRVCAVGDGVPLFVVHDFDKAGFEIAQRLTQVSDWAEINDRVTYYFENAIDVTDLGLRLADVEKYGLGSESVEFKGHFASDSIATPAEREFLRSGRRVELNSFTSPDFIDWIETKLKKHLPKRLVPDDGIVEQAYRRALAAVKINSVAEEAVEEAEAMAEKAAIPKTLRRQLRAAMKENPDDAWDVALYKLVASKGGGAQ